MTASRPLLMIFKLIVELFVFSLMIFATFAATLPVSAAVLDVTHYDDDFDDANGTCSLREAIRAANQNAVVDACRAGSTTAVDLIRIPAGRHAIDLTSGSGENDSLVGDLDITEEVTLRGTSAGFTIIEASGGTAIDRLIHVLDAAIEVSIERVSLLGGIASAPDGRGGVLRNDGPDARVNLEEVEVRGGRALRGGGLFNAGDLRIYASSIVGNQAVEDGTGTNSGGGIASEGSNAKLRIVDAEVIGNSADDDGGGILAAGSTIFLVRSRVSENAAGGDGGGLYVSADLNIGYTEFSENSATRGGGVFHLSNAGELRQVSIVDNTATAAGGGLYEEGMGIMRFSTVAGNQAPQGAGIYVDSNMALFDSITVARNLGVGVHNQAGGTFEQSIFAENTTSNCGSNPPGAGALNMEDSDSCSLPPDVAGVPNFSNTDPLLGTLANHGGPTKVLDLLPGSPAINAASSELRPGCENDRDQRGRGRGYPRSQNDADEDVFHCDLGAFEFTRPFFVDSVADDIDASLEDDLCATAGGVCTLRAAIQQASAIPGLVEVEIGPGTYALSRPESGASSGIDGDLDIVAPIHLRGTGGSPDSVILDGNGIDRVLEIRGLQRVSSLPLPSDESLFQDLTITGGAVSAPNNGGGLLAQRPVLLERVIFQDNTAERGAAVSTWATGFSLSASQPPVRLLESTVRDHSSNQALFGSHFRIERSSVIDNSSSGGEFLRVEVLNSTFSGNAGGNASAFFSNQAIIDSSTFLGNDGGQSQPAIFLLELSALRNSIFANNLANGSPSNCVGNPNAIVSLGFNLADGDGVDCALFDPTDQTNTDPALGSLADNGGLTLTHLPSVGSSVIDRGDDEFCPAFDQRSVARPMDGDSSDGPRCDIGAVEALPEPGAAVGMLAGSGLLAFLVRRRASRRRTCNA